MDDNTFNNMGTEDRYGFTKTRQVSLHSTIGINDLRQNAKLCDASLVLDNGDMFPIHRSVLSGSSDYFRILFETTLHEGKYAKIPMKTIDSSSMELILQYIYKRHMDINDDNVLDVMRVADYLCIKDLVQLCHEFVVECLGPENCVTLLQFADYYYFGALREESYKYIVRNFMTVAEKSDELMKLGQEEFKQIIGDDRLNVKHEENVWEIIEEWADKDPENRKDDIAFLLHKHLKT